MGLVGQTVAALIVGVFALAIGGPAHAQNKCAAAKIRATCKNAACKASLEATQASSGIAPDPGKVQTCEAKFAATFAKYESTGGCLTSGNTTALEAKVDAFVADLDSELNVDSGTNPNTCEAAKIKAASRKASCKCKLEAKQAQNGGSIDPGKVQKCEANFASTFARSEATTACNTIGDAAVIEAKVDAFVAGVDTEISAPSTTTTTTSTTTSTMFPPGPVCCEAGTGCLGLPNASFCVIGVSGTPVFGGTVCDASGACVPPPGTPGGCCELPPLLLASCSTSADAGICRGDFNGTYHPAAVCLPSGLCVP